LAIVETAPPMLMKAGLIGPSQAHAENSVVAAHGLRTPNPAKAELPQEGPTPEDTPPPPAEPEAAPGSPQGYLIQAAHEQGIDPNLILAVSYWESHWNQQAESDQGAIGLMQVMPLTADRAGPTLLGRAINLRDPHDNAAMGTALIKDMVNKYGPRTGLAAYYQGEPALFGGYAARDTWFYADGILRIRDALAAGKEPASADPR
jgi:soluble lytic murein transglycosylase-like protein